MVWLWTEEREEYSSDLCTGAAVRPLWSPVSSRSGTSRSCSHTRSAPRTRERSHIHQCLRSEQTGLTETVHKHTSWTCIHFIFAWQHGFSLTCISYLITFSSALSLHYYVNQAFYIKNRHHLVCMTCYGLFSESVFDFCYTVPLRHLFKTPMEDFECLINTYFFIKSVNK